MDDSPARPEPVAPFTPEVVSAVRRHMNEDHRADALLICQELGGVATATEVTMTDLDESGIVLAAVAPDGRTTVRVPWANRPADRGAIRTEIVRLYEEASARRGSPPREGQH